MLNINHNTFSVHYSQNQNFQDLKEVKHENFSISVALYQYFMLLNIHKTSVEKIFTIKSNSITRDMLD